MAPLKSGLLLLRHLLDIGLVKLHPSRFPGAPQRSRLIPQRFRCHISLANRRGCLKIKNILCILYILSKKIMKKSCPGAVKMVNWSP